MSAFIPAPEAITPELILGSASPRRLELLAQLNIIPDQVLSPEIDETPHPKELPKPYVERMAANKAKALLSKLYEKDTYLLLTADTVVSCGRRILPKAETETEALTGLTLLSGRSHMVTTSIAIRYQPPKSSPVTRNRTVSTRVTFKRLAECEIRDYLASNEWHGKAGGYAIQGLAAQFVRRVSGSYSAVVGLPLYEVAQLIKSFPGPVTRLLG